MEIWSTVCFSRVAAISSYPAEYNFSKLIYTYISNTLQQNKCIKYTGDGLKWVNTKTDSIIWVICAIWNIINNINKIVVKCVCVCVCVCVHVCAHAYSSANKSKYISIKHQVAQNTLSECCPRTKCGWGWGAWIWCSLSMKLAKLHRYTNPSSPPEAK